MMSSPNEFYLSLSIQRFIPNCFCLLMKYYPAYEAIKKSQEKNPKVAGVLFSAHAHSFMVTRQKSFRFRLCDYNSSTIVQRQP